MKQRNVLLILIIKFGGKFLSMLVKLFKLLFATKAGLALTSMAVYSVMFTWQFALVLLAAIFIHENGHVWAMKKCGVPVRGIYFLPFVGAVAVSDSAFPSRGAESFVALMGPVFGLGTSLLALTVFNVSGAPLWAAIAAWVGLINLFNLLPLSPLDGGRVFKTSLFSISSKLGLFALALGIVAIGLLAWKYHIFILGVLVFLAFSDLLGEHTQYLRDEVKEKFIGLVGLAERIGHYLVRPRMNTFGIIASLATYGALCFAFVSIMHYTSSVPGAKAAMDVLADSDHHHVTRHAATALPIWFVVLFAATIGLVIVSFIHRLVWQAKFTSTKMSALRRIDQIAAESPELIAALAFQLERAIVEIKDGQPIVVPADSQLRKLVQTNDQLSELIGISGFIFVPILEDPDNEESAI